MLSNSSLFDILYEEVFSAIQSELKLDRSELVLEIPPEMQMGDFAFPTFRLAKALRKAPNIIAADLLKKLESNAQMASRYQIVAIGPYVNFTVKKEILANEVLNALLLSGSELGEKKSSTTRNVVLEFSSPNIAKAFNIYHLRSTMIGNCLYRILKSRGFTPIAINHLGDWGTQFGTLTLAYQKWGDDKQLEARGLEYLVELYVRVNKEMETDAALKDETRANFSKLEKGDPELQTLWKKFVDLSLKEFSRIYARLGVHFDHYWGESHYISMVPELEEEITRKKVLVESEGAQVVMLDQFNMPPCIIRKQDGSSIYATRDLAAAIYRQSKFSFEKMIYVVGGEQKLHFQQVFKVLEILGFDWAAKCEHVGFGLYRFVNDQGEAEKMSTRKGKFVTLEYVLDEAVEKVLEVMKSKNSELPEKERAQIAEIIGTGAIVYNDLATDRNHDVNFNIQKVCDFEGETGPYIMYAHTRCLGILRNAPKSFIDGIDTTKLLDLSVKQPGFDKIFTAATKRLQEKEELELIRTLAKLPRYLDLVLETMKPSYLANFLIDITKQFNAFYRAQKVLVEDAELAQARLALVLATQRTLLKGLSLLGMRAPERM